MGDSKEEAQEGRCQWELVRKGSEVVDLGSRMPKRGPGLWMPVEDIEEGLGGTSRLWESDAKEETQEGGCQWEMKKKDLE